MLNNQLEQRSLALKIADALSKKNPLNKYKLMENLIPNFKHL